nr:O-antigen ligase family protein [Enterovibrio nigricans]
MPLLLILIPAIYKMKLAPVKLATMVFAVVATLMSAYHLSPSVKERTDFTIQEFREVASGDIKDSASTGGRLQLWYASIEALKANPIYGLSHGDRETLNQHLYQKGKVSYWVTGVSRGHAHSQYFEMLASNGLFSIPAVFAMLVFPLLFFIRKRESEYARAGAIFVAGITIFGLTEVLLQANLISVYFGIFMAFFFAATLYGTKDNEQNALS